MGLLYGVQPGQVLHREGRGVLQPLLQDASEGGPTACMHACMQLLGPACSTLEPKQKVYLAALVRERILLLMLQLDVQLIILLSSLLCSCPCRLRHRVPCRGPRCTCAAAAPDLLSCSQQCALSTIVDMQ